MVTSWQEPSCIIKNRSEMVWRVVPAPHPQLPPMTRAKTTILLASTEWSSPLSKPGLHPGYRTRPVETSDVSAVCATSPTPWLSYGPQLFVDTMHKSKGTEFDDVILVREIDDKQNFVTLATLTAAK